MVSITLEEGDNAQVIFETLNARGAPLLALDLVKNAVFLEAGKQELDANGLYETVWKPEFDDPDDDEYWRTERRQGRLSRPIGELFLMHWLTMKLRRVVPATELFSTFRVNVLSSVPPPTMAELIPEIRRESRSRCGASTTSVTGSVESKLLRATRARVDTATLLPLVLFLFREPAVSVERRRRALRMIESWLVRRMILGWTAKNYNKHVPVIIGRVAETLERADETVQEELRAGVGKISKWPTDDEVRDFLLTQDVYGWRSQKRIVMLLRAVEMSLYSSKVEAVSVPLELSIEHVMPQQWGDRWPLPSSLTPGERAEAEAARNAKLHLIGNLTLVTAAHNSALSNAAWSAKRTELNRNSRLLLNGQLIGEHPEVFDEAAIEARCAFLANQIISIWPGPDAWGSAATSIGSR